MLHSTTRHLRSSSLLLRSLSSINNNKNQNNKRFFSSSEHPPHRSSAAKQGSSAAILQRRVDDFRRDVERHLVAASQGQEKNATIVHSSAWLVSDNIVTHLLHSHFPELLQDVHLVAVDTLHLFPETHQVADAVQKKYNKPAKIFFPQNATTREQFESVYGHCEALSHAEFDYYSKVEPFSRALKSLNHDILITGRRSDQGEVRQKMDVWEEEKRNFNPLAHWTWADVLAFADAHGVPVNPAHNYVFRASEYIEPTRRHLANLPWTKVDLGKPYWQATSAELYGSEAAAKKKSGEIFVFQSFGDIHTSVPVRPHESERAGRFVRYANTECGIHTRVATKGAAHGGGKLVDLLVDPSNVEERKRLIQGTKGRVLELNERQACDVELLVNGGFSPLNGFMDKETYDSVVSSMRLPEQQLFGLPVVLDVDASSPLQAGDSVLLRFAGQDIAVLDVSSRWTPNKKADAVKLYTTDSEEHPSVHELYNAMGADYLGGRIHGLSLVYNNRDERFRTPRQVRKLLAEWKSSSSSSSNSSAASSSPAVVAFQCRNVIHRAHYELLRRAAEQMHGSIVLVHPTVGPTQPDDLHPTARIPAYDALVRELQEAAQKHEAESNNNNNNSPYSYASNADRFLWSFLPYSMKMAGPREAIQHMIIRKNYGATHFIVGRDMAGTKSSVTGNDFYGPYDAQELAKTHASELGMEVLTFENMVYTTTGEYMPESEAKSKGLKVQKLSGTEFRRLLRSGEEIPSWFSFSSVVAALRNAGDELDDIRL